MKTLLLIFLAIVLNTISVIAFCNDNRNIDYARYDSLTKLHLAAMGGRYDEVIELIKSGANVNIKNMNGHTALDFALGSTDDDSEKISYALKQVGGKESRHWGKNRWDSWSYKYHKLYLITYPVSFMIIFVISNVLIKREYSTAALSFSISWMAIYAMRAIPNLFYGGLLYVYYKWMSLLLFVGVPCVLLTGYLIGSKGNLFILKIANFVSYALMLVIGTSVLFFIWALSSGS